METLQSRWTGGINGRDCGKLPRRLVMVVGYDGSPPAHHALNQAVDLLRDRKGAAL
jgi:hypothetical protein